MLEIIDWIIIISFGIISLSIGLYYKNRASSSIADFFLGGRKFPWYLAGISMVATTFAADTPLAVTELVAQSGVSGNWLWWNMAIGGMLTTFFFAKLWRRANVLTELEFIELRYEGKPAAFLRGFKAVYLGVFLNVMILGWVNLAMMSILEVFFGFTGFDLLLYTGILMAIAAIYSSLSGIWGVAVTDVIQFCIAMTGCIVLAVMVVSSEKIGGISGLKAQLPEGSLNFFPTIGEKGSGTTLALGIGSFLAYTTVQWWASWYPGAEPGGGGYVAQRMMSAKDEKHSLYATLFFQIAHFCIRPWPWIIVALCCVVLYPDLQDPKQGYVLAMKEFLPAGLKGLLLVAFFAAYMSTISTQLNWGASFVVNDLYKRFIRPQATESSLVGVSRVATIGIMIISLMVTTQMESISGVWKFIMECGAGLGLVLILRWYWWRINAWSEFSATLIPVVIYSIIFSIDYYLQADLRVLYPDGIPKEELSKFYITYPLLDFPSRFFIIVACTTIGWLSITLLTRPQSDSFLATFYNRVRPLGAWGKFSSNNSDDGQLQNLFLCWLFGVLLTYSALFCSGKIITQEWNNALIWLILSIISITALRYFFSRTQ